MEKELTLDILNELLDGDITEFLLGEGEDIVYDGELIEFVEQDGGGEGGTEYCQTILTWKNQFYKVTYSYYSYDGFNFGCAEMFKVTPKEKTITVYE